jgi:hypothetical protein
MPGPFPGMDPYLEDPTVFPDLHDRFIAQLSEALNARLPPPYYSGIASRIWIEPSNRRVGPDVNVLRPGQSTNGGAAHGGGGVAVAELVAAEPIIVRVAHGDEIRESFLEIYSQPGGERLVATIEVLSVANKTPGAHGRDLYIRKQNEVLDSQVHLVEIDLLRSGIHSTAVPIVAAMEATGGFDYHISIRPFDRSDEFLVYPIWLTHRLPTIAVPLLPGDPSVTVDLQAILDRCYDTGHYERRVRYNEWTPSPPLSAERRAWAEKVLQSRGRSAGGAPSQVIP